MRRNQTKYNGLIENIGVGTTPSKNHANSNRDEGSKKLDDHRLKEHSLKNVPPTQQYFPKIIAHNQDEMDIKLLVH